MRAIYLTGERIHLRAMKESDKDNTSAWFDYPFPADTSRAETFIKDENKRIEAQERHLLIALNEDDTVVGRFSIWSNGRVADIWFTTHPLRDDSDQNVAEALRLIVPWLIDEGSFFCVTTGIPADQTETIAAAEALGMVPSVRLREHIARAGHRVDLTYYQALGQAWTFPEEAASE